MTVSGAKFCAQCGARLPADARFCEGCGSALGGPAPAAAPAPSNGSCPRCGKADGVSRAADFLRRTFSKDDVAAAEKAGKTDPEEVQIYLEKPEDPREHSVAGWMVLGVIPVLNFLLCWFAPMHAVAKVVMVFIVGAFVASVAVPELAQQGLYPVVGCIFIAFYWAAVLMDRGRRNALREAQERPAYLKAAANWEQLHYCSACDVCWLASNPGTTVAVNRTEDLLQA